MSTATDTAATVLPAYDDDAAPPGATCRDRPGQRRATGSTGTALCWARLG